MPTFIDPVHAARDLFGSGLMMMTLCRGKAGGKPASRAVHGVRCEIWFPSSGHGLYGSGLSCRDVDSGFQLEHRETKVQGQNVNRRTLRHTNGNIEFLGHNKSFRFALTRALKLYRQSAIYTFIPKNACSTMRLTLAIENGCIRDASEHRWIHANNSTFVARLEDLIAADYTFVILRDPFIRTASCFLDKILQKHPPVAHMEAWLSERGLSLDQTSFVEFLRFLSSGEMVSADEHWRPQTDFLIFDDYDEYFCIENFEHAVTTLNTKLGIRVVDSRPFLGHGRDQLHEFDSKSDLSRTPIGEFARMRSEGRTPALRNLFSEECVDLVKHLYRSDIDEYRRRIGPTIHI